MKKAAQPTPPATTTTTQDEHERAAARAAETERELARVGADRLAAEASFERFRQASESARQAFDSDPSAKPAYVDAKRAEDDARDDLDRASRLLARAEGAHAQATAEALERRRAWLNERVSPAAAAELRVPVIELVEAARGLLERAWHLDGKNGAIFRRAVAERAAFLAEQPSEVDETPAGRCAAAATPRLYPSLSSLYSDQAYVQRGASAAWSRALVRLFATLAEPGGVPHREDA